jgi:hypothetical protein
VRPEQPNYAEYLYDSPHLAGPEFTCADVMVVFQLTTATP